MTDHKPKDPEKMAREEACQKDILTVLEKHNCILDGAMLVTPSGNQLQFIVTAK